MVICAAGLSPVRGLPHRKRPHYCLLTPSPSCAAGSLASARSPRTARIPQARRLLCSSTGQRCCLAHAGVLHGVLTRRAHTARSHGVRTTQRLAFAAAATSSLLLRPGLFPARSSRLTRVPRQEGRWATARASTARSEVNYSPSISARQARRVGRARCAVLASHPLRRALSTSIPRTPAHNLRGYGAPGPLLLGRRRALETVDAEVDDAGSTMPSTAPAVAAVVSLATAA